MPHVFHSLALFLVSGFVLDHAPCNFNVWTVFVNAFRCMKDIKGENNCHIISVLAENFMSGMLWIRICLCFVAASWYPKSLFSAVDLVSDISAEKSGKNSTNPVGRSCPMRAIIQRVFVPIR